jgi:hypothetical protein
LFAIGRRRREMPTEKQLAANRRNARNSSGPRSSNGKARVGKKAYRHGLSINSSSGPAFEKQVERLALKFAKVDHIDLADARALAAAEFDLDRVARVKTALINRMHVFGAFDSQLLFSSTAREIGFLKLMLFGKMPGFPPLPDPSWSMPKEDPKRTLEAIRRALPELKKLERYEKRAFARRDLAIRAIVKNKAPDGRIAGCD